MGSNVTIARQKLRNRQQSVRGMGSRYGAAISAQGAAPAPLCQPDKVVRGQPCFAVFADSGGRRLASEPSGTNAESSAHRNSTSPAARKLTSPSIPKFYSPAPKPIAARTARLASSTGSQLRRSPSRAQAAADYKTAPRRQRHSEAPQQGSPKEDGPRRPGRRRLGPEDRMVAPTD